MLAEAGSVPAMVAAGWVGGEAGQGEALLCDSVPSLGRYCDSVQIFPPRNF